jgi:hypothetical protein
MRTETRYHRGDKIGKRFLVHRPLAGGMGKVYFCLDLEGHLPYALKTLQTRHLMNPEVRDYFGENRKTGENRKIGETRREVANRKTEHGQVTKMEVPYGNQLARRRFFALSRA